MIVLLGSTRINAKRARLGRKAGEMADEGDGQGEAENVRGRPETMHSVPTSGKYLVEDNEHGIRVLTLKAGDRIKAFYIEKQK